MSRTAAMHTEIAERAHEVFQQTMQIFLRDGHLDAMERAILEGLLEVKQGVDNTNVARLESISLLNHGAINTQCLRRVRETRQLHEFESMRLSMLATRYAAPAAEEQSDEMIDTDNVTQKEPARLDREPAQIEENWNVQLRPV